MKSLIKKIGIAAAATGILLANSVIPSFAATDQFGPFPSTSTDGGSCGSPWANDTFDRFFSVRKNSDGSYNLRQDYRNGTFVTIGPVSPGACETGSQHGNTVPANITGKFSGTLEGTVTGGTYNPNGCSTNPSLCSTTSGFVATVFPGGSYTCLSGGGKCSFNFLYDVTPTNQGVSYKHWQDTNNGGGAEVFNGDIAL